MKGKGEAMNERELTQEESRDFMNYLFNDNLNNISRDYVSGYQKNRIVSVTQHTMTNITKNAEGNTLTVVVEKTPKTNTYTYKTRKTTSQIGKSTKSYYRFYRYSGKCTEENEYEGENVTILFPDEEASKEKVIKKSPVIFRTLIKTDGSDHEMPKVGEIALIRSGIFAAFEAFAKDHPDIAFKYIPTEEFLTVFSDLNRDQNKNVVNSGIFFKKCRIIPIAIPSGKGFISLEELLDSTHIDPTPPKYKPMYKDKKTLGLALMNFKRSLDTDKFYEHYDLKEKIGKILLWDHFGEETKNIRVGFKGAEGYRTADSIEKELLNEYMKGCINYYVDITGEMFSHYRSTLFENPDKPVADDYVRAVLKEKRIEAKELFEELREKPWDSSFLNPNGDRFSTIFDDFIEELSQISIEACDGEILTKPFLNFDGAEGFTELPNELKEKGRARFDGDDFFDVDVIYDMSVNELMNRAQYYDYKGDKTAYFWSSDNEDGHLVIFGKKSFDKILEIFEKRFE